jgi:EAL domain-containing protein (putative c-di-GMP-specific phosphodiesterase class I)
VGTSIGIASGSPEIHTTDQLISSADAAMYMAKRSGGGRLAVDKGSPGGFPVGTEAELATALADGQIVVQYQPIMDLVTSRPVGAEALVRWEHPEKGLLLPDRFVPVAEQSRLILDLGRLVLSEACGAASRWLVGAPEDRQLVVTVNLSAAQLADPDLVADVASALAETGLDASHLVLEITESMLMKDRHAAAATLRRLKDLGVQLAIDDFGTGYSSLAYLRRFPVDMLKIAGEFTGGLGRDPHDDAITYAIVDLAMTLGLQVVAEGIETPDQHAQLTALGCPLGQGFLFTGATSAAQVHRLLRKPAVPGSRAAHLQG